MTKQLKILVTLLSLMVLPSISYSADEEEPEMVCVQDLNENGYAGEEGETATCVGGPGTVITPTGVEENKAWYCPIGAVACENGEIIIAEPVVERCPTRGWVVDPTGEYCVLTTTELRDPTYHCPVGWAYTPSTGLCFQQRTNTTPATKSCPPTFSYNSQRDVCERGRSYNADPTFTCQHGYTFDNNTKLCSMETTQTTAPTMTCSSGFTYSTNRAVCVQNNTIRIPPDSRCPAGSTLNGNVCRMSVSAQQCFNTPGLGVCEYSESTMTFARFQGGGGWSGMWYGSDVSGAINSSSPAGDGHYYRNGQLQWTNPEAGGQQMASLCRCASTADMGPPTITCQEGSYNSASRMCEITSEVTAPPTKNCPSGTLNNTTGLCETRNIVTARPNILCTNGVYNGSTGKCDWSDYETVPVVTTCSIGTYNPSTRLCQNTTDHTQAPTIRCPAEFAYNAQRGICEKVTVDQVAIIRDCPADMVYRPSSKQCERIEYAPICPLAGGGQCVLNAAEGQAYCSSNPCMDIKDAEEIGNIDGTMLVDNGERDADGQCLDDLQIFTGRASFCQLSGKSTAFQNCCKNDGKVHTDSMGTVNELSVAIDTIQAMYEVTAAAYSAYSSTIAAGGSQAAASSAASTAASEAISALMNPATIAWAVVIYLVLDYLMQSCDAMSMETSLNAESGFCHYVGEYCKTKWLGHCVQKARGFCCFNSMMGRIIHEQGRPQLNTFNDWGEADSPDCRGFDPDEFRDLDFSKIDFSEYYAELVYKTQGQVTDTMTKLTEQFYDRTH